MTARTALVLVALAGGCSRADRSSAPAPASAPAVGLTELVAIELPTSTRGEELLARVRATFSVTIDDGPSPVIGAAEVASLATDGRMVHMRPAGLRATAAGVEVALPKLADGAMVVRSTARDMSVSVRPVGFAAKPVEWAERIAVFPMAAEGVDVVRVVQATGVEDFYQVHRPREQLTFEQEIRLHGVAGLRLVANTLELLDPTGNPMIRATPPRVFDSDGRSRPGTLRVVGCAYDEHPAGPWGRPVVAPGSDTCRVIASVDGKGLSYPVLFDPTWQGTGTTKQTHAYHQMHYLKGGIDKDKVLLVNGTGSFGGVTELFNPKATPLTWASSSSYPGIATLGQGSTSVALRDGTVVSLGGAPLGSSTCQATVVVRSPTTGAWSPGAAMSSSRCYPAVASADVDGKEAVLVFGGQGGTSASSVSPTMKTGQYYDPGTDNWTTMSGTMSVGRARARAVKLNDGRILVAGGEEYSTVTFSVSAWDSADFWTPSTKAFSTAPNMNQKRSGGELVALGGSKPYAVFAGGTSNGSATGVLDTLEVFDGTKWSLVTSKLAYPRLQFASALLDDGRVLFTGGFSYNPLTSSTVSEGADLFVPGSDPTTGTIVGASLMSDKRHWHAMIGVPSVGALVTGGLNTTATIGSETTSSEVFNTTIGGACGTGCPTGLFCVDGVCCSTSSCPSGQKCNNPGREGVCTKPKGDACTSNAECATGFCVTGVCCESACAGGCNTCAEAGALGTCKPAAIGTDPAKFCGADPFCSRKCDGTGKCSSSYPSIATACGASAGDGGTGPFCTVYACNGFGTCSSKINDCGLTCTTTVSCDEATKTCTPIATGIKAGYCVIESTCYAYGDVNPKDSCLVCDPPTSKLTWSPSTEASCTDGGVDSGIDTGVSDTGKSDTGTKDSGKPDATTDTGASPDTGITEDSGVGEDTGPAPAADLPEAGGCTHQGGSGAGLGIVGFLFTVLAGLRLRRGRA